MRLDRRGSIRPAKLILASRNSTNLNEYKNDGTPLTARFIMRVVYEI